MPSSLAIAASSEGDRGYDIFHSNTAWQLHLNNSKFKELGITTPKGMQEHMRATDPQVVALGQQYADNLAQYGAKHWYDWCPKHWGTKWDACDAELNLHDGELAQYGFNTAWAPAEPVIVAMSKHFSDLTFTASFDEEGGSFKYEAIWCQGSKLAHTDL